MPLPEVMASWDGLCRYVMEHHEVIATDANYVVIVLPDGGEASPPVLLLQPREVGGRARLEIITRICAADEVPAEVVLAHSGAAIAGSLVVLDSSLALRHVMSLDSTNPSEVNAALGALAVEMRAFQHLFVGLRATASEAAASVMTHWI